ncbi:DUF3885 domain-containing protein [uncultured Photobacterium sp.]|uniref:DUF3885 domain-containing protein n=1 Tax=uncultured Photobacterium sp. TaxID=173973 RepID=UPI00261B9E36|nr:DUF3885 domain-containing protein [uncultured Photobacterium sp.]
MDNEEIKLEKPLFYKNHFALRFEIGPPEIGAWSNFDNENFNEEYFNVALDRAVKIFSTVFSSDDDCSIVYQIYSDGRRKIKNRNFLFKQVSDVKNRKVVFTDHREIYSEDLDYKCECWKRATISNVKVNDVNVDNILIALINSDFGSRSPSLIGECFFINHNNGLVLNLYDDRGMDVVAPKKDALEQLYRRHNDWILDYDRKRIDSVFS